MAASSAFPATITHMSARIGTGRYQDILGLTMRTSTGPELILSTGQGMIEAVTDDEMVRAADQVAQWVKMRVEQVAFTPRS